MISFGVKRKNNGQKGERTSQIYRKDSHISEEEEDKLFDMNRDKSVSMIDKKRV